MRIAIVQLAPRLADLDENLATHEEHLSKLASEPVDLVVFPELSLTGYFLRDLVPEVALSPDSPQLARLARFATDRVIVVGFVLASKDYRYYNAAAVFWGEELRGVHRKIYLPTYGMFDELRYWAAGRRLRSFPSPIGRLGILICEDVWHLSLVTLLQLHRVDWGVFLANSPLRGPEKPRPQSLDTWQVLNRAAALTLQAPVVFANRAGCEEGVTFAGGSAFVGPQGDVRQEAKLIDEDVLVVEYDPRETRAARTATPLLRDENPLLTYHELRRLIEELD